MIITQDNSLLNLPGEKCDKIAGFFLCKPCEEVISQGNSRSRTDGYGHALEDRNLSYSETDGFLYPWSDFDILTVNGGLDNGFPEQTEIRLFDLTGGEH